MNGKVPKHIKDKCKRMEKLCNEACELRYEVEKWCKANGINTISKEWEENVRDEISGCDAVLSIDGIEGLLNQ